jgi:hypothetical protein
MNQELQKLYERVLVDTSRSRLEPYCELVLAWRKQGRTYRRIVTLLDQECAVKIGCSALHEFVRRRSRLAEASTKETG